MLKRKFLTMSSLFWIFSTLMLLSGCGTMVAYEGPTQPKEKIAMIKTVAPLKQFGQKAIPGIICIDGKKVGPNSEIEVLPGKHQIEIYLQYAPIFGSPVGMKFFAGYLDFEAEAGHEYISNGYVVSGQSLIWVEDNNTQQVVARGAAVDINYKNHKPCS